MKKRIVTFILFSLILTRAYTQVGIGTTTPDASAILELDDSSSLTRKGLLLPRMTSTERNSIVNPAEGLWIYNIDSDCYNYFSGGNWMEICGSVLPPPPSAVYTIGAGSACSNTSINGTYAVTTALDGTNTITLDATVTTIGLWNINTNTVNGYSFSGIGIFTGTGTQQITITGDGLPLNCGTNSFTITGDAGAGGTCTKNVTIAERPEADWADRNLGASQVATSIDDAAAYGDLYQWGRLADGHESRLSGNTALNDLSSTDVPGHGNFIITDQSPLDWRSPQNDDLWQGLAGINNPCPSGYRIPTMNEAICEIQTWLNQDAPNAFASSLKLTTSGARSRNDGIVAFEGNIGAYWLSTIDTGSYPESAGCFFFIVNPDFFVVGYCSRAEGISVRCIKD